MDNSGETVSGSLGGLDDDGKYRFVNLDAGGQRTNKWCWASSAEMISTAFGTEATLDQERQATDRANQDRLPDQPVINCSDPKTIAADLLRKPKERVCVRGGWPAFKDYGFTSEIKTKFLRGSVPLSWGKLTREIDAGRPVAFSWLYEPGLPDEDGVRQSGGGHMMVATGYIQIPRSGELVLVHDPWPPETGDRYLIPFSYYETGPWEHWRTYYKIAAPGLTGPDEQSGWLARLRALPKFPDPKRVFRNWQVNHKATIDPESEIPISPQKPEFPQLDALELAAAREVAREAVRQLEFVIGDSTLAAKLETATLDKGDTLQIEDPFPIFEFSVAEVRKWLKIDIAPTRSNLWTKAFGLIKKRSSAEEDGGEKINPDKRLVFPLASALSGQLVATVSVRRFKKAWKIESIARSSLLAALRDNDDSGSGRKPIPLFAVDLPSLYQFFLAYEDGIEPIYFDRGLGFDQARKTERRLTIVEVFDALKPLVEDFESAVR